ncbi:MAG: hypothetical protein M1828_003164 [Chrysothrix sp. TS-e1954]|nr:MAG: hypothetical protein M1828_003164 [Chrysothrix sp. TS-e1954]
MSRIVHADSTRPRLNADWHIEVPKIFNFCAVTPQRPCDREQGSKRFNHACLVSLAVTGCVEEDEDFDKNASIIRFQFRGRFRGTHDRYGALPKVLLEHQITIPADNLTLHNRTELGWVETLGAKYRLDFELLFGEPRSLEDACGAFLEKRDSWRAATTPPCFTWSTTLSTNGAPSVQQGRLLFRCSKDKDESRPTLHQVSGPIKWLKIEKKQRVQPEARPRPFTKNHSTRQNACGLLPELDKPLSTPATQSSCCSTSSAPSKRRSLPWQNVSNSTASLSIHSMSSTEMQPITQLETPNSLNKSSTNDLHEIKRSENVSKIVLRSTREEPQTSSRSSLAVTPVTTARGRTTPVEHPMPLQEQRDSVLNRNCDNSFSDHKLLRSGLDRQVLDSVTSQGQQDVADFPLTKAAGGEDKSTDKTKVIENAETTALPRPQLQEDDEVQRSVRDHPRSTNAKKRHLQPVQKELDCRPSKRRQPPSVLQPYFKRTTLRRDHLSEAKKPQETLEKPVTEVANDNKPPRELRLRLSQHVPDNETSLKATSDAMPPVLSRQMHPDQHEALSPRHYRPWDESVMPGSSAVTPLPHVPGTPSRQRPVSSTRLQPQAPSNVVAPRSSPRRGAISAYFQAPEAPMIPIQAAQTATTTSLSEAPARRGAISKPALAEPLHETCLKCKEHHLPTQPLWCLRPPTNTLASASAGFKNGAHVKISKSMPSKSPTPTIVQHPRSRLRERDVTAQKIDMPLRIRQKHAVPKAPKDVTFYRSLSKRPLAEGELLSESDDEPKEDWIMHQHNALIDNHTNMTQCKKEFMKRFDAFIKVRNPGRKQVSSTFLAFARQNASWLQEKAFLAELVKKGVVLRRQGLITSSDLAACVKSVRDAPVDSPVQDDVVDYPPIGDCMICGGDCHDFSNTIICTASRCKSKSST